MSVVVLIVAGLLLRSFAQLQQVAPGFNPSNVLTLELTMSGDKYKDPQKLRSTFHELWQRLEGLPGVVSAGGISSLPLSESYAWGPINVEGHVLPPGEKFVNADERIVSGHYFETMQIPLLKGRLFNDQDTADKPRVLVVDEYMVQQLWPNEDPLGKRVSISDLAGTPEWATVIGVVGRVKQYALDADSRMALYMAEDQYIGRAMNIALRTSTDPASMASAVNHELHELDSDLPTYRVITMDQRIAESLSRRRFTTILLALFAGLALALATVGIYGVMAYLVSQGTRELGIRMALGADGIAVVRLILADALRLVLIGLTIGTACALPVATLLDRLLFGVSPFDPLALGTAGAFLTAVALGTAYRPARRAARLDPLAVLRAE
jgi:predicted permease